MSDRITEREPVKEAIVTIVDTEEHAGVTYPITLVYRIEYEGVAGFRKARQFSFGEVVNIEQLTAKQTG